MAKMKHIKREEKYRKVELIEGPLLKQFEYFCVNLSDVKDINLTCCWPRSYQEDLRDLNAKIPQLDSFNSYWNLRNDKPNIFSDYLEKIVQLIKA